MRKIKYPIHFLVILFTLVSCKGNQGMQGVDYENSNDDESSPEARRAFDRLTNGGTTFPTGQGLAQEVSTPGDIGTGECPLPSAGTTSFYTSSKKDPAYVVSLKNYEVPARGCIPLEELSLADAEKLMASQNLTTRGATDLEKRKVGLGLLRIQQLNGGVLKSGMGPGKKPYPFVFKSGKGSSSQGASQITITRNEGKRGAHKHYGHSVAQHVHEYAHLIGNQGTYSKYAKAVGSSGKCMASNYSKRGKAIGSGHTGEEFAEAFTAFVTDPGALLKSKRTPIACKKAFDFFVKFFNKGDRVKECL